MNRFLKQSIAVVLNFSFFTNQLLADLPPVTFDSAEWVPMRPVGRGGEPGWNLVSGNAVVSAAGAGFGGGSGKALKIPADTAASGETRISRAVSWDAAEPTAFIDFQVKPAASPEESLSSFYANGTQVAFQVPEGSSTGEIWVYHGGDGTPAGTGAAPVQWIKTAGTFPVAAGGSASASYVRMTLRHDYGRNLWDLFIDGKLAAANLGFQGRGDKLASLEFFGSAAGDTLVDDVSARPQNMLFPDADTDGLPDDWERAHGSNPNLYDRDTKTNGRSFLDLYMESLWPGGGGSGVNAAGTWRRRRGLRR